MKVVLLENVKNVGNKGEIVEVKEEKIEIIKEFGYLDFKNRLS